MRIRFWGTRGSIAKPGGSTVRYGGNTSCVEVRSNQGTLVVLDCGTGAHGLGVALESSGDDAPCDGHILVTHTHWDHIQGFPFFQPLFRENNSWQVWGPLGLGPTLRDTLSGQMQYTYFPVAIDQLKARVAYRDLVEGSFDIDDIRVTTHYLNHPSLTLGYRLEVDGLIVVYATDHEPHISDLAAGGKAPVGSEDERHVRFCENADLLIHDTQYTHAEYLPRVGWGHSTIEYAVDSALAAGVERLALFHHDPLRDDEGVDRLLADARDRVRAAGSRLQVIAATEGEELTLDPGTKARTATGTFRAAVLEQPPRAQLRRRRVLIAVEDADVRELLREAAAADDVPVVLARDGKALSRALRDPNAALLLMSRTLSGNDALDVSRALARQPQREAGVATVVVAQPGEVDRADGVEAGVTDWLVAPFTGQYARTRIRAWLLRAACRWERAPTPNDEEHRLDALHALELLDTPPEERFDRYTRIAAALFGVPVALVSLVDRNRQWFKSRQGLEVTETSRDMAFCAHAIMSDELMLVEDALNDGRFADNPLVTERRVRFYAGAPLRLGDGARAGTLCLMDHRPRRLDDNQQALLRDLGNLVERELLGAG